MPVSGVNQFHPSGPLHIFLHALASHLKYFRFATDNFFCSWLDCISLNSELIRSESGSELICRIRIRPFFFFRKLSSNVKISHKNRCRKTVLSFNVISVFKCVFLSFSNNFSGTGSVHYYEFRSF